LGKNCEGEDQGCRLNFIGGRVTFNIIKDRSLEDHVLGGEKVGDVRRPLRKIYLILLEENKWTLKRGWSLWGP